MGLFSGLDTEAYDRTYSDRELFIRIKNYFTPHAKKLGQATFFLISISIAGAGQPLVVSKGVGTLVGNLTLQTIIILGGIMGVLGVTVWGANWIRHRILTRIITEVVATMRHDAFVASINHDMAFFDEFKTGRIISRITTDTQEFAQVTKLITDIVAQLLQVVILLSILFYISVSLTFILLAMVPAVAFLTIGFRRLARVVTHKGFTVLGKVNASIQEAVTGISIAKNFRQEAAIYGEFGEINQQAYRANLERGIVLSGIFPILNVTSSIGIAGLLYLGGSNVDDGIITVGAWYLFMASVDRFWFPLINLSAFWSQLQGGLSAAERIFALIDAKPLVQQRDNHKVNTLNGEIIFKDVDFRYTEQEPVLQNFSVHIAPGETVALVGHTGAGKSSLIKLITRFYEFQSGTICIDGQDLRTLELNNYRAQLGLVSQSPFLFSGTVADNIRYARPNLTDADIEAIARRIGQGDWLETLPEGLQTDVGERGSRLSMGQRQLVALTRVLAQEPPIFILDEATASIDPFTEAQIQEAMDLILARSTSIIIAHRLSTVRSADRILVLEKGRIIEQGSHNQLMQQGGHYAELYNTYFRHQSLDYIEAVGKRKAQVYAQAA